MELPTERRNTREASGPQHPAEMDLALPGAMKKRSVVIAGHRTSVSLENAFWGALKVLAAQRALTVNQLVTEIDRQRDGNLSSAIRVYVLLSMRVADDDLAIDTSLTAKPLQ